MERTTTARVAADALASLCGSVAARGTVAIVVAHPDDEVIGMGGQMAARPRRVICVYATDGAPRDGRDAHAAGFDRLRDYARARAAESAHALALARVPHSHKRQLAFADQTLVHRLGSLHMRLQAELLALHPAIVVTHPYEGGHPDHDALSLVVGRVVTDWPRGGCARPALLEFACYHQGAADDFVANGFAPPATGAERRIRLDIGASIVKRQMLACFTTQRRVLEGFGCADEWLRVPPSYDYTVAPNSGRVLYDRYGWSIDSRAWLAQARQFLEGDGGIHEQ